jgi:hypothetical protein
MSSNWKRAADASVGTLMPALWQNSRRIPSLPMQCANAGLLLPVVKFWSRGSGKAARRCARATQSHGLLTWNARNHNPGSPVVPVASKFKLPPAHRDSDSLSRPGRRPDQTPCQCVGRCSFLNHPLSTFTLRCEFRQLRRKRTSDSVTAVSTLDRGGASYARNVR